MCEICDKRKLLATLTVRQEKINLRVSISQMKFTNAALEQDRSGAEAAKAEFHRAMLDLFESVWVMINS